MKNGGSFHSYVNVYQRVNGMKLMLKYHETPHPCTFLWAFGGRFEQRVQHGSNAVVNLVT